ncbi:MAG: YgjP-like metallopeptidase domain-containing protein [Acholeplasmataceae bacterium]
MIQVFQKNGKNIRYQIVIKNNKHTYFRIKDDYVLVTTNKKMVHLIDAYLNEHFESLYQKLNRKASVNSDMIQLRGKSYHLTFHEGRFRYEISDDEVMAFGKDIMTTKKKIYMNEIKKMITDVHPKVLSVIVKNQLKELPIKYKYLKSKFGSYHKKHDEITLNTFLATLEPIYLEYVLFHEYAHKIIFNHSKAFYDILDTWMIEHKIIQKALKKMVII